MRPAIPGQVVEVVDEAIVLPGGTSRESSGMLLSGLLDEEGEGVGPGDWVLILCWLCDLRG